MPRKTPNALLKKRGSKKVRKNEPEPAARDAGPTRELSAEGARAFARLSAALDEIGVNSATFAELITITADAIGDIEIANRDLLERGFIAITERGETKNPSWTVKTSATATAQKGLTALGITPTDLGKLTAGDKPKDNPFAEFIS